MGKSWEHPLDLNFDLDIPWYKILGWCSSNFGIWVWVKIGYPNDWMLHTKKIDVSICGPPSL